MRQIHGIQKTFNLAAYVINILLENSAARILSVPLRGGWVEARTGFSLTGEFHWSLLPPS